VSGATSAWSASGALAGLAFGLGVWLVAVRLPWVRRPSLDDRLAPYLRDVTPSRLLAPEPVAAGPLRPVERLLAPVMADAVRWAERISGGAGTVASRLRQLGDGRSVEAFRAEQVVWGFLGAVAGGVTGALTGLRGGVPVVPVVALVVIGGLLGVLGRDRRLSTQVARRQERMLAEFPTVAELLALSVGAGEGAIGALDRVSRCCRGELSAELARTLADARAGAPLVDALRGLADRTGVPAVVRFVDGLTIAVERGTPLADVLRAQAGDVRDAARRRLIESGGVREIAMMVPVVFLVLPVTVVFVLFPGLAVLDLSP